ncbi:MAG: TIM barrel protein [Patescibacteria group bacterium]
MSELENRHMPEQETECPTPEQRERIFHNITLPTFPELTGWNLKLTALFLKEFSRELRELGIPHPQIEYVLGNRFFTREESTNDLEKYLKGLVRSVHCAMPRAEKEPTLASKLKYSLTSPHPTFLPSWNTRGTVTDKGRLGAGLETAHAVGARTLVMHAAELAYLLMNKKHPEAHIPSLVEKLSDARDKIAPEVAIAIETQGNTIAQLPREKFEFVYNPIMLAELLHDAHTQHMGLTIDFQHCRIHDLDPTTVVRKIEDRYPGLIQHAHVNAPSSTYQDAHQSFAGSTDQKLRHQLQQFFFALAKINFNGGLVPELDPPGTVSTHARNLIMRKIIDPARGIPYEVRAQELEEERQYLHDVIEEIHSLLEL